MMMEKMEMNRISFDLSGGEKENRRCVCLLIESCVVFIIRKGSVRWGGGCYVGY